MAGLSAWRHRATSAGVRMMPRWTTGSKIFLVLSIALLPLAIIAIVATLRVTQIADTELRSHLRVAATEATRGLAIELVGDMAALRVVADQLAVDPRDTPSCARVSGVFAPQAAAGTRFVVQDATGRVLCGTALPEAARVDARPGDQPIAAAIVPRRGVVLEVAAQRGGVTASAFFPRAFLAEISRPSGFGQDYGAAVTLGDDRLELSGIERRTLFERRETSRNALGIGSLVFDMQVRSAPIGSPLLIALALPLLMWVLAAVIAWIVVDRQLIAPLRRLRGGVAAYAPGDQPDVSFWRGYHASEIQELGDTFRALSRTVALHEAGLAEGLMRQTKLTREVHHRVKNNLQVIASLINFHARSAKSAEAADAYASIQRRVDALAVVHRYHFAEMEENRGVGLRAVLGELASNIRATAPDDRRIAIVLDVENLHSTQDVAVAVAFLATELIELAMTCAPGGQMRLSLRRGDAPDRAVLRLSSRALVDSDLLRDGMRDRYGRVVEGLSRQLRSKLEHDPLAGAYEIAIAVLPD